MGRRFSFLPSLSRFAQSCVAEFLGTFFFILIIATATTHVGSNYAPIAIGFGLAMLIYSYGYVSKAQFNPAVTFGLYVAGIQNFYVTAIFTVVQVVAGCLAALVSSALIQNVDSLGAPRPYDDSGEAQLRAFFAELLFTFNLAHTMINVAVSRQSNNSHFGLAIGMAVLSGAYSVGVLSGGAFNPAVTTSLQLIQLRAEDKSGLRRPVTYIWLYWIAELLGGILAGVVFHLLDEETPETGVKTRDTIQNYSVPNFRPDEHDPLVDHDDDDDRVHSGASMAPRH
jgi:aquaporin Z